MISAGIDIGGTKIEAQRFDADWQAYEQRRVETPGDYADLIRAIADQIQWATNGQASTPVGIGAAGLINPKTGLALTANLSASGKPWADDIAQAAGRRVPLINDCRAMTVSEAVFGAGRGFETVMGFSIGTGIAGGIVQNGRLLPGQHKTGGEFGHLSLPAHIVAQHNLPILHCGCGRLGCFETLAAGPGLARLLTHLTGLKLSPDQISQRRADQEIAPTWQIWLELIAAMLSDLTLAIDPDVIVLGGGFSIVTGLDADINAALEKAHLQGFPHPMIKIAEGGAASCARGAAYHAWLEA